jgi:drug/metabolite transporter (DMT)-like permease
MKGKGPQSTRLTSDRAPGGMAAASSDSSGKSARLKLAAELGLLGMVLIWGLNFVVVKSALEDFSPLGFNSLRHLLASAFMLVVLLGSGGVGRPQRSDLRRILWLGVVGNFVYQMAFIFGLNRTRAGNASLMLALVPLFLLVITGTSPDRRVRSWVGAIISVSGVALVSGSAFQLEGGATLIGDLLMVTAAAIWATYTAGSKPLIARYGPIRTTAWTLWVGSVGLVLSGVPALIEQDWSAVRLAAWGGLLFSALLSVGVAYLLWYWGVQQLGGERTAIFSNLTPVVALGAGAIWLGERLTMFSLIGAAMVIGGVLLVRANPAPEQG